MSYQPPRWLSIKNLSICPLSEGMNDILKYLSDRSDFDSVLFTLLPEKSVNVLVPKILCCGLLFIVCQIIESV